MRIDFKATREALTRQGFDPAAYQELSAYLARWKAGEGSIRQLGLPEHGMMPGHLRAALEQGLSYDEYVASLAATASLEGDRVGQRPPPTFDPIRAHKPVRPERDAGDAALEAVLLTLRALNEDPARRSALALKSFGRTSGTFEDYLFDVTHVDLPHLGNSLAVRRTSGVVSKATWEVPLVSLGIARDGSSESDQFILVGKFKAPRNVPGIIGHVDSVGWRAADLDAQEVRRSLVGPASAATLASALGEVLARFHRAEGEALGGATYIELAKKRIQDGWEPEHVDLFLRLAEGAGAFQGQAERDKGVAEIWREAASRYLELATKGCEHPQESAPERVETFLARAKIAAERAGIEAPASDAIWKRASELSLEAAAKATTSFELWGVERLIEHAIAAGDRAGAPLEKDRIEAAWASASKVFLEKAKHWGGINGGGAAESQLKMAETAARRGGVELPAAGVAAAWAAEFAHDWDQLVRRALRLEPARLEEDLQHLLVKAKRGGVEPSPAALAALRASAKPSA
jgi:hypothetical protein